MPAGVYITHKKDNTEYYRVSITFKNKHISLGSYTHKDTAACAYEEAKEILACPDRYTIQPETAVTSYGLYNLALPFEKFVTLVNYRDNDIYIKTPVYLCNKYFLYFTAPDTALLFDTDDLFYYSNHKIMSRGGYFFVNDYGMQTSILSRYGIRPHSVKGRDYVFRNGNECDFRYENVYVINRFYGVSLITKKGLSLYRAAIHINGKYIIGDYQKETHAAIAYNKAIDMLKGKTDTVYTPNYVDTVSSIEYASIYNMVKISRKFRNYVRCLHAQK